MTLAARAAAVSLSCVAGLAVAGREHDGGADAAPPAGRNRVDHGGLRNDKHGDIHALRQIIDAADARPPVDLGA
jgi:hypothetical protein